MTATRTTLLALAERVEAATGADRELDVLVALAKGWRKESARDWFTPPGVNVRHHKTELPRYTASLDDAMSLVPSGWRLQLREWDDEAHLRPRGAWQAILTKAGASSTFDDMVGSRCEHASTPALALTAAAIRALAQETPE